MAQKDVLLNVLEKFTSKYINLTPFEKADPEGRKLQPLSNLGMGYVFEELIRKFNEDNNEEAGDCAWESGITCISSNFNKQLSCMLRMFTSIAFSSTRHK